MFLKFCASEKAEHIMPKQNNKLCYFLLAHTK